MKILYLDSWGGSIGMLAKAMCMFTDADADCIVRNFKNTRKHQIRPHETIAKGAWSKNDVKNFLHFAVDYYDIIQTSSFPYLQEDWDLYDWLTEQIGRRHVWRATGFVHSHFPNEEVNPENKYVTGFNCTTRTFEVKNGKFFTGDNLVFYSFPEKQVYLEGDNVHWLPTIRDPDMFKPNHKLIESSKWNILCPVLDESRLKGSKIIRQALDYLERLGYNYELVSKSSKIRRFENWDEYSIPYWEMPKLYNIADIVIDSVYMGGYGNPSVEAMLCEKPVITFSKFEDQIEAPVVDVDRDYQSIAESIIEVLESPKKAAYLGKRGREYAIKYHSPQAVAKLAYQKYEEVLS